MSEEELNQNLKKVAFELVSNYQWRPNDKREVSAERIDNLREALLAFIPNRPKSAKKISDNFFEHFGITPHDVDSAIISYFG